MSENIKNPEKLFNNKFRKVFYELDYLEIKIKKVDGIIFKNHRFSKDELINSPHHTAIDSITRKIGDDAAHWYARGVLSDQGKQVYDDKSEKIDYSLHHLNLLIENRQPTLWESIKGSINDFAMKISNNMPTLRRILIVSARILNLPVLGSITTPLLLGMDKLVRNKTA